MSRQELSRMEVWGTRLSGWPRLVRVILCAVIALLLAVFASQLTVLLLGPAALYDLDTATLAFVISVVVGVITYAVGWWMLVGFGDNPEPSSASRAAGFVVFGVLIAVVLVIWFLISAVITALPPEVPI